MDFSIQTNENLIKLYREGNEDAKNYFFEKNINFAYHLGHGFAKGYQNKNDYDDILSEACKGLVKAFNTFNVDSEYKFTTYAGRVIYNELVMFYRRNKNYNRLKPQSLNSIVFNIGEGKCITLADTLEQDAVSLNTHVAVCDSFERVMKTLSSKEKRIYKYMIQEGRTQEEVATKLNLSQPHISRLLNNIKSQMLKEAI